MPKITLITGGRKSGKSEFAEKIASKYKDVTYVALSESRPEDLDWQARINLHKSRRMNNWKTIETDEIIDILRIEKDVLLIDSIGGFVIKGLPMNNKDWELYKNNLVELLSNYENPIIIVGEQVGWGLVSEYKVGNLFADRLGEVLNLLTKVADNNWITINGKALKLDDIFIDI